MVDPDWPAPRAVRALVTTRELGDMAAESGRRRLRPHLPAEPSWLRQVHGARVSTDDDFSFVADAVTTRQKNRPCTVMIADCMPVFFAHDDACVVGVAHAGWRGLAAGVLEATIDEMGAAERLMAWLGPAIGPRTYEVGEELRAVFDERHFASSRPGHWLLDLYGVAREKLERRGLRRIYGGGFCTYSEPARFFSYRRDRSPERMAAAIWLT